MSDLRHEGAVDGYRIELPDPCLVVLVGASGSGKSTFARAHFGATEVVSSDTCRGLVSNDETSLEATGDAFDLLQHWVGIRLKRGLLTVVDATSVQKEARASLIALARRHHALSVAIVLNVPDSVCAQRNELRPDRPFGANVIQRQNRQLRRSLGAIRREGFHSVHVLNGLDEVGQVSISRTPLWVDRRSETGPFDIIGDIHGCLDETLELLRRLGYGVGEEKAADGGRRFRVTNANNRTVIFLGDLVDRGPDSVGVLRLAMDMVEDGIGLCLPGNHDEKLLRKLKGRDVRLTHGLAETVEQLGSEPDGFANRVRTFLDGLVSHLVLDGGNLVVAHAGLPSEYQGRASRSVREFALFGETTGETDESGRPVRVNWAETYRGNATVVYGHTAVERLEWLNRTIDIDTGCVFGGALTALRYPERELVSVASNNAYYERPDFVFGRGETPETLTAQQRSDDTLDFADFTGKRRISTRLMGTVHISDEQGQAALEILSRFAIDPKWLIYLPPTMSPVETAQGGPFLEHPDQAWEFYRSNNVSTVVCQEKHMGSRAVAVVCRDPDTARTRFGVIGEASGTIYTRTGRSFFDDDLEKQVVDRLAEAFRASGIWNALNTDWVCLDAEIMPWSYKALGLIQDQYGATFAAGRAALEPALGLLELTEQRGIDVSALRASTHSRLKNLHGYRNSYTRFSWPVAAVDDLKIAPFHLLASEGTVHVDRSHSWHMEVAARLAAVDPGWIASTTNLTVHLESEPDIQQASDWWLQLTEAGGEGMVVKPAEFVVPGKRGPVQPAVKVRGREYLRIIYGPEYTDADQIERLRARGLTVKRMNALREFALGIESLERFVAREPLYRVHECAMGVLALESEPVDPRL